MTSCENAHISDGFLGLRWYVPHYLQFSDAPQCLSLASESFEIV